MSRPTPAPRGRTSEPEEEDRSWTLLTNHGRVLLLIAQDPRTRIRDLAEAADITERSAQGIVTDLDRAGYLSRHKVGRRNEYVVNVSRPFRHPAEAAHTVGELIEVFAHGVDDR